MNSLLKVIWNFIFNLTGMDISSGAWYRDWSFYLIELKADYEKVKALFAGKNFTPKETAPGETRLQIVGCDMRDVQYVGPYREVSIQVPVEPLDSSPDESYAHLFLPVTTEAARWGGVDISGFPKFIADIDIKKEEGNIVCQLFEGEKKILEFRFKDRIGTKNQWTWVYYGTRKQRNIMTSFDLQGLLAEDIFPENAQFELGSHKISDTLGEIILSEQIVRLMTGHAVSGILHKPVQI